jgi:hypothetical protein
VAPRNSPAPTRTFARLTPPRPTHVRVWKTEPTPRSRPRRREIRCLCPHSPCRTPAHPLLSPLFLQPLVPDASKTSARSVHSRRSSDPRRHCSSTKTSALSLLLTWYVRIVAPTRRRCQASAGATVTCLLPRPRRTLSSLVSIFPFPVLCFWYFLRMKPPWSHSHALLQATPCVSPCLLQQRSGELPVPSCPGEPSCARAFTPSRASEPRRVVSVAASSPAPGAWASGTAAANPRRSPVRAFGRKKTKQPWTPLAWLHANFPCVCPHLEEMLLLMLAVACRMPIPRLCVETKSLMDPHACTHAPCSHPCVDHAVCKSACGQNLKTAHTLNPTDPLRMGSAWPNV